MERPEPFQIYRHFKGHMYQVICIAKDSEDGHEIVVYRGLYEPYTVYARSLEMFVSPVDSDKYPDVKQKNRFMLVTEKDMIPVKEGKEDEKNYDKADDEVYKEVCIEATAQSADCNPCGTGKEDDNKENEDHDNRQVKEEGPDKEDGSGYSEESCKEADKENCEEKASENIQKECGKSSIPDNSCEIKSALMRFLEAEGCDEQLRVLSDIRDELDEKSMTSIEFSLGLNEQKGRLDDRFVAVKHHIMVKQRYEKAHR